MARIRHTPEEFIVDEIPLYAPSGFGEHTFVRIEKRLRTTEQVARDLARAAGVEPREVGFAGRKDRRALTRQWFSVPRLAPDRALGLALPGARVLEAAPHRHKLRTGQLRGNRFEIAVRDVGAAAADAACVRLAALDCLGMPNRFGPQRFGRDANNVSEARRLLRGARIRDRRHARFLLSAFQAAVFNDVLARRALPLDRVEPGDVAMVHASGGLFRVENAEAESARAASFEISATGPIFGTRMPEAGGAVGERERAVFASHGVSPLGELRPPRGVRLRGARRALRVRPEQTQIDHRADRLHVRFSLPAGSYATVLLEELLGAALEVAPDAAAGP